MLLGDLADGLFLAVAGMATVGLVVVQKVCSQQSSAPTARTTRCSGFVRADGAVIQRDVERTLSNAGLVRDVVLVLRDTGLNWMEKSKLNTLNTKLRYRNHQKVKIRACVNSGKWLIFVKCRNRSDARMTYRYRVAWRRSPGA